MGKNPDKAIKHYQAVRGLTDLRGKALAAYVAKLSEIVKSGDKGERKPKQG